MFLAGQEAGMKTNRRHSVDLSRRSFLIGALGWMALPSGRAVASDDWVIELLLKDRWLNMRRRDTDEEANLCYWRSSIGWNIEGYEMACYLLRDVKYDAMVYMDTTLLDTLCIIQAWLDAYSAPSKIQILSGYRTEEHNSKLEGAAKNSLHMQGKAADIYIDGLPSRVLREMSEMLAVGGVGFYPSKGFVHIDTGRVRSWTG